MNNLRTGRRAYVVKYNFFCTNRNKIKSKILKGVKIILWLGGGRSLNLATEGPETLTNPKIAESEMHPPKNG